MKIPTQWATVGAFVLLVIVSYQNCAPKNMDAANDVALTQLNAINNDDVLKVETESISSQLMCETNNSLNIVMKKSAYEGMFCSDQSTLIDGVVPGPTCVSGVVVNSINVISESVSCQQLQICGSSPTSITDIGNGKVRIRFDQLPWGCHAKLNVMAAKANGLPGEVLKRFAFQVQPPACRFCASSGNATCGACADPGCSVAGSSVLYNVGQTIETPCAPGTTGQPAVVKCAPNGLWLSVQTAMCSGPGSGSSSSGGSSSSSSSSSGGSSSSSGGSSSSSSGGSSSSSGGSSSGANAIFKCSQLALSGQYCVKPNSTTEKPSVCPAGKKCAGGAADPVPCGDNNYSLAGEASCHACVNKPADMSYVRSFNYNKNNTSATCTYSLVCKSNGAVTPDGLTCALSCSEKAKAGQYCVKPNSTAEPQVCPAGSSCAGKSAQPVKCGDDKFSTAGSGACASCSNTLSDMTYVNKINYAAGNTSSMCTILSSTCKASGKHPAGDKISCVKK